MVKIGGGIMIEKVIDKVVETVIQKRMKKVIQKNSEKLVQHLLKSNIEDDPSLFFLFYAPSFGN